MKIEMLSVGEVKEYEDNPREIPEEAVEGVARSIREFGFKNPVIVDAHNVLVAGHTRVRAARKLKMEQVPAVRADDLTPEQIRAFRIADNKLHELAQWDYDLLPIELGELQEAGYDLGPIGFEEDELSGLQHAVNLKLRDEATFWAEYQNEPVAEDEGDAEMLDADEVAGKTNGRKRGRVPVKCEHVTAFIDVGQKLLYYVVAAWEANFTGYVIDYGTYPEQPVSYFTSRDVDRTLRRVHQGMGVEGAIYAGLEALTGELLGKEWPRDDGAVMRIDRCLIDQGWQTDVVHQFCRQSEHAAVLMAARGHGITASQKPISEYDRHRGDKIGHHWWIPSVTRKRALRHVEVDTNYWKSFVHERLATAMGDPGCLSIFGRKAVRHRLFAEHLTAEYRVRTEGRGRTVEEWKLPAHKPDNHWLDCVVGCAAGASMQGAERVGAAGGGGSKEQKRIRLSELQNAKRR